MRPEQRGKNSQVHFTVRLTVTPSSLLCLTPSESALSHARRAERGSALCRVEQGSSVANKATAQPET